MSIPLEDSVSQGNNWDFDSTVPCMSNAPDLCPIQSVEEPLGHHSSPTTSVLSSTRSGLIFWRGESKKPNRDIIFK